MNVELVAQMFKNYQSNVLFHLEGEGVLPSLTSFMDIPPDKVQQHSYGEYERAILVR